MTHFLLLSANRHSEVHPMLRSGLCLLCPHQDWSQDLRPCDARKASASPPPTHQHFLSRLFPSQLSHGHWPPAPSPLAGPSSSPSQNPSPVRPLLTCAADTVPHPFTMATLFKGQLLYRNDFHSNIGMSREDYNLGEDPSELHVTPRSRCHSIE